MLRPALEEVIRQNEQYNESFYDFDFCPTFAQCIVK